jgi:hypothetical protein
MPYFLRNFDRKRYPVSAFPVPEERFAYKICREPMQNAHNTWDIFRF